MLKILCLGSRIESIQCLEYLVNNFKNIEIIGIVPHFLKQDNATKKKFADLLKKNQIQKFEFNQVSGLKYDLGLSLLFDKKVKPIDIDTPKLGFINLHLGPLPRFKGANSIAYAIKRARKDNNYNFGVTMHYMDHDLDTGPIIDLLEVPIKSDDYAHDLFKRSSDSILPLFKRNISKILSSKEKVEAFEQDPNIKSYFFKRKQLNHEIKLSDSPDEIYDSIRALTFKGKPKPYAMIGNFKIYLSLEDKF